MQSDDHNKHTPGRAKGDKHLPATEARRERLAKNLRDNLQRRKQQMRARRAGAADETSGLPAAKSDESED
jgi:ribosome recycling factor